MTTPTQQETLLSIADIARHFDLPESTARYYCKRFAEHIPSVGEGRRRRYRPETLEVIALVLEEMQKSRTAASVEELLATQFPRNVEIRSLSMSLPPAHEKKDIQVVSASPVAPMTPHSTTENSAPVDIMRITVPGCTAPSITRTYTMTPL